MQSSWATINYSGQLWVLTPMILIGVQLWLPLLDWSHSDYKFKMNLIAISWLHRPLLIINIRWVLQCHTTGLSSGLPTLDRSHTTKISWAPYLLPRTNCVIAIISLPSLNGSYYLIFFLMLLWLSTSNGFHNDFS